MLLSVASSLRLSRLVCEKDTPSLRCGAAWPTHEKTVWKLPALSQATGSISVHESYYSLCPFKEKTLGALTHSSPGASPLAVCCERKEDVFDLRNTSHRTDGRAAVHTAGTGCSIGLRVRG